MTLVMPVGFFGGSAGQRQFLTTGTAAYDDSTPYSGWTFSSVNTGPSGRLVVIAYTYRNYSHSFTSIVVGGVTATIAVQRASVNEDLGYGAIGLAIAHLNSPGGLQSVQVNTSEADYGGFGIEMYVLAGIESPTPHAVTSGTSSVTLSVPADGIAIAAMGAGTYNGSISATSLPVDKAIAFTGALFPVRMLSDQKLASGSKTIANSGAYPNIVAASWK